MRRRTVPTRERIREVVVDPEWQKFRLGLKGHPTAEKLRTLRVYFDYERHDRHTYGADLECAVCVRVDSYIKGLCRGGQLKPGASLGDMVETDWSARWIKE